MAELPDVAQLMKSLGLRLKRPELLKQSLTHRSYLNEHPRTKWEHNERLEFLGDAVLELAVTRYLFVRFPDKNEGDLTAYRSALVNAEMLSEVAGTLGLNDFLLLSRGEKKDTGRARQAILANALEALIGAIFLDSGLSAAEKFIRRHLLPQTETVLSRRLWHDAKSLFQERAQEQKSITPIYRLLSAAGPDHDKIFTVGLYLGDELVVTGSGSSKQRAEQEAASRGLKVFGWDQ